MDQAQVDREAAHTLRLKATKAGLLGSLRDHEQVAWERNVGWAVWVGVLSDIRVRAVRAAP